MKSKTIVLSIIILIVLLLSLYFVNRGKPSSNVQLDKSIVDGEENLKNLENIIKVIVDKGAKESDKSEVDSNYFSSKSFDNLRDPFTYPKTGIVKMQKKSDGEKRKPNDKPKNIVPSFELKGIVFDKENSMAIINGEVYKEGDLIKKYRVVRITKSGVKLVSRDSQIYLKAPEFD